MMDICIDARMINHSGIGTYIHALLELGEVAGLTAVLPESYQAGFPGIKSISSRAEIYTIHEQLELPFKLGAIKPSLYHVPHYNIPVLYRGRMVVTVHDLIHLKFPHFLPGKSALYYARFMLKQAVNRADRIIAVSKNTKNDIIDMLKVPEEKIEVIYNGLRAYRYESINSLDGEVLRRFGVTGRYLLYVGNVRPHKNIVRLLKAFDIVRRRIKDIQLIIVGEAKGKIHYEYYEPGPGVIFTGFISRNELDCLYRNASLFVFPSLYEGFGYPPLEAMQRGVPVVCSNTSSLPEIAGDAAVLFDPYQVEDMVEKIIYVLDNSTLAESLVSKGREQVNKFNIDKFKSDMISFYKSML